MTQSTTGKPVRALRLGIAPTRADDVVMLALARKIIDPDHPAASPVPHIVRHHLEFNTTMTQAALKAEVDSAEEVKHIFKISAGPPYVVATDPVAALALLDAEHPKHHYTLQDVVQMPDDEPFTIFYDDLEISDAEAGPCQYECDSDRHNHVMNTCGTWAELGTGLSSDVIWEYEG